MATHVAIADKLEVQSAHHNRGPVVQGQAGTIDRAEVLPAWLSPGRSRVRRHRVLLGMVAAIALFDQSVKWLAWRYIAGVRINDGGDQLVPSTVGSMYSGRLTGGLLDLFDSGLLIVAAVLFVRRPRSALALIPGSAVIGGWSSNLLDRLVAHYWTAPGSVRGVVDFIPMGQHYYNVADLFIIVGAPLFVVGGGAAVLRRVFSTRPVATAPCPPRRRRPGRVRAAVVTVTVLVLLAVGFGTATFGGATAPRPTIPTTTPTSGDPALSDIP